MFTSFMLMMLIGYDSYNSSVNSDNSQDHLVYDQTPLSNIAPASTINLHVFDFNMRYQY